MGRGGGAGERVGKICVPNDPEWERGVWGKATPPQGSPPLPRTRTIYQWGGEGGGRVSMYKCALFRIYLISTVGRFIQENGFFFEIILTLFPNNIIQKYSLLEPQRPVQIAFRLFFAGLFYLDVVLIE